MLLRSTPSNEPKVNNFVSSSSRCSWRAPFCNHCATSSKAAISRSSSKSSQYSFGNQTQRKNEKRSPQQREQPKEKLQIKYIHPKCCTYLVYYIIIYPPKKINYLFVVKSLLKKTKISLYTLQYFIQKIYTKYKIRTKLPIIFI